MVIAIGQRRLCQIALAAGSVGVWGHWIAAAQEVRQVPQLSVGRLADGAERPVIDGRVEEAIWSTAQSFGEFIQQEPNDGQPATERTEIRFLLDRQNLYIGVISFDSEPDKIIVSQSRRDADLERHRLDRDPARHVQRRPERVCLRHQPVRDRVRRPGDGRGTRRSARPRGASISNWDADWTVRAQITERGWEAEFAIPLKTLRYSPGDERTWGFNVMRNIRRKNEQVFLSPVPRGYNLYRVSVAGKLTGLSLPARRDVEAHPVCGRLGQRRQERCGPTRSTATATSGSTSSGACAPT